MNPITTGAAVIGGAQLTDVINYLFQLAHITPPPANVAGTIAALLLMGGHALGVWLMSNRGADPLPASPAPSPIIVPAPMKPVPATPVQITPIPAPVPAVG